jgi:hypothetical protein
MNPGNMTRINQQHDNDVRDVILRGKDELIKFATTRQFLPVDDTLKQVDRIFQSMMIGLQPSRKVIESTSSPASNNVSRTPVATITSTAPSRHALSDRQSSGHSTTAALKHPQLQRQQTLGIHETDNTRGLNQLQSGDFSTPQQPAEIERVVASPSNNPFRNQTSPWKSQSSGSSLDTPQLIMESGLISPETIFSINEAPFTETRMAITGVDQTPMFNDTTTDFTTHTPFLRPQGQTPQFRNGIGLPRPSSFRNF